MEDEKQDGHRSKTRYLKPVETVSFTAQDVISGLFAAIHPSLVSSVNLLHGDRKGVIRLTLKTADALVELDQKLESRKVLIHGVRLAAVGEYGQFLKVTLVDVPEYLTSNDIERELREYGTVVHVRREFIQYRGHKIENETRLVLFSTFHKDIPSKINIEGHQVYVSYKSPLRAQASEVGDRSFSVSRPTSRHVVSVGQASAGRDCRYHGDPQQRSPGATGRAPSPIVTPETEKLPEMRNTRPRHVMASPQPYRRNSVQVQSVKSSVESGPKTGPSTYSVEVQVEAGDLEREEGGDRGWASGYSAQDQCSYRRYFDNTDTGPRITEMDKFPPSKSNDFETKI